jgi:hypothetical protein
LTVTTSNRLNKLSLKGMLEHLTTLYYEGGDQQAYEQALQESRRHVRSNFPGLTVARAEVTDPVSASTTTHVLAPESAETEHRLGWHDVYEAVLALDDGITALWDIASLEVRRTDGSWLAGNVSAGGAASQSHLVTAPSGEVHFLSYGDVVRNVVFRKQKGEAR